MSRACVAAQVHSDPRRPAPAEQTLLPRLNTKSPIAYRATGFLQWPQQPPSITEKAAPSSSRYFRVSLTAAAARALATAAGLVLIFRRLRSYACSLTVLETDLGRASPFS